MVNKVTSVAFRGGGRLPPRWIRPCVAWQKYWGIELPGHDKRFIEEAQSELTNEQEFEEFLILVPFPYGFRSEQDQWCRRRRCRGSKRISKIFWFVENPGKNGAQRLTVFLQNQRNTHEDLLLGEKRCRSRHTQKFACSLHLWVGPQLTI